DLWTERVAPALRERAPRIRRDENGEDAFFCDGLRLLAPASMSQAGKADPDQDRSVNAVYRGAFDPQARLADMARDGVDAEVVYPSIAMRIFAVPDRVLQEARFEAYNSWAAEFCQGVPGRFQGVAVIALDDLDHTVAE